MDVTRSGVLPAVALAGVLLGASAGSATAQTEVKSHSSGFFLGIGLESDWITTEQSGGGNIGESGMGGGLIAGYGFTPRWSMYADGSTAVINASGDNTYGLAHVDLGARVHFRTGANVLVPFVQAGLSRRTESQRVTDVTGTHDVTSRGGGIALGGGFNTHFNPRFALSASLTYTGGSFNDYRVDGRKQSVAAVDATSARLHIGLIWFPGAK